MNIICFAIGFVAGETAGFFLTMYIYCRSRCSGRINKVSDCEKKQRKEKTKPSPKDKKTKKATKDKNESSYNASAVSKRQVGGMSWTEEIEENEDGFNKAVRNNHESVEKSYIYAAEKKGNVC